MNKVIFLDRDGVLNIEKGHYISSESDFEINLKAISFLQKAIEYGYKLVVITNQGGIAKGIYSHATLEKILEKMAVEFERHSITFDDIFYCPHHDDYGKCLCRKPNSLLIERAIHRFNTDKKLSFMIGDRQRDIDAAMKTSVRGVLIESNSSLDSLIPDLVKSDKT